MVKVSTLNNWPTVSATKVIEDKEVIKIYFKIYPEFYGPEGDDSF